MSGGQACQCAVKDKTKWVIVDYLCNYSAFNGYHWTPSDYSAVRCTVCLHSWRTKAAYVSDLTLLKKDLS